MSEERPVRVAVVGSGMAGLVTSYLLHQDSQQRYAVKLFESGESLSLDAASVSIPNVSSEKDDRVDLPMRAFAGGYYNNLKSMYDFLGVKYKSQPFLFEFAKASPEAPQAKNAQDSPYFIHASNLHQTPPPRPTAITTTSYLVEVVYLIICYAWFSACCFLVKPGASSQGRSETLDEYLKKAMVPRYFVTYYLLPLISSVTTCPHESLLQFPAKDIIEYKRRTHGAPHYTVCNGVSAVQERLVNGIEHQFSTVVAKVKPVADKVQIFWKQEGGETIVESFDKVILAVAPDIVGQILEPLSYHTSRIPTVVVESVVHTDQSSLGSEKPQSSQDAQLIYLRTSSNTALSRTESLHVQPCGAIVTTCPFSPINSSLVVHSAKFTRVLRSSESRQIVNSIFEDTPSSYADEKLRSLWKNGDDNVYLVGGWCWDGMVLLEGCIVSAMRVADAFGVDIPWR